MLLGAKIREKLARRWGKTIGGLRRSAGLSYSSAWTEMEVFNLLGGKSVALVGNAASLGDSRHGAAIDAHDVVIRCNRAPMPSPLSHGHRTDVLAISLTIPKSRVEALGAAHVFYMSPRPAYLPRWLARRQDFFLFPTVSHGRLMALLGSRPTTGLMLIDLVSRSPARAISLYGFDFFSSHSLSNEKAPKRSPHDFAAEGRFVAELAREDLRLQVVR